jgi:N-acyl-L-homoserine lactone synthetase
MTKMARYRHRVFIETLGWPLTTDGTGMELDQFDRPDTIYINGVDERGTMVASARLLSTVRPYLLSELFPQLMHGLPLPRSPSVWEVSRFAVVDFRDHSGGKISDNFRPSWQCRS